MTFRGVLTALVTPFTGDVVDEHAFRALVRRQVDAGIDGLVPCGTTGEAPTLQIPEHVAVIRWTVEEARGRPVLAGIGSNDTRTACDTARRARDAGANGVLATAPYYNKPTQEGLYRHFVAIAEAVPEVEVCLYDVPGRTAVRMAPETIGRLSEVDNITCLKDATSDLAHAADVLRLVPDDFAVLSGDDLTTLAHVATGGVGCISVASNVVPERMVRLVKAAREGRMDEARRENLALMPLFRALFVQSNPLPCKTALAAMGLCEERFRLPMCPMDDGPRTQVLTLLRERYGLIG